MALTQSSEKQARALEEATQINTQQTDEVHRLKAALNTRACAQSRRLGDPRFDGEVALRTEIEALRCQDARSGGAYRPHCSRCVARAGPAARQRSTLRLPSGSGRTPCARPRSLAASSRIDPNRRPPLKSADSGAEGRDAQTLAEIRRLKSVNQDQAAEISRLKAALATYEAADHDDRGVKESKIAMKARLTALQALTEEQGGTIQALRAELAAGNEKLARQAAYFMEEMRRLGIGHGAGLGPGAARHGPEPRQAAARRAHQRSAGCASRAPQRRRRTAGESRGRLQLPSSVEAASSRRSMRRRSQPRHGWSTRRTRPIQMPRAGQQRRRDAQVAAARPHHRARQELRLIEVTRFGSRWRVERASSTGCQSLWSFALRTRPSNWAPSAMTRFF